MVEVLELTEILMLIKVKLMLRAEVGLITIVESLQEQEGVREL
jgi:hypothetical protein